MSYENRTVEVCVGCGHPISLHYNDVTGVARCRWEHHDTSTSGVIGLPYTETCDCADFQTRAARVEALGRVEEKKAAFLEAAAKGLRADMEAARAHKRMRDAYRALVEAGESASKKEDGT